MSRALAAALLVLLLVPAACAQATIDDVVVPPQTVAGHVFEASVTLTNHGEARDVVLIAALYDVEEGKECGPAADPRFRAYTQLFHDPIRLDRDETVTYPPRGERWLHRYTTSEMPAGGVGEWCVFVARSPGATAQVQYEDYASLRLPVRATNAPPVASFAWEPQTPVAAQEVRFSAEASDPDGDAVALSWDFGFVNASGRARGEGTAPVVRFYPAGTYTVALVAGDGFSSTPVQREIVVLPEGTTPATVVATQAETPLPLPLALLALALGVAARRKRD